MQKQTIISTPSIADINALVSKWMSIPGNAGRTLNDFHTFLTADSIDRSIFLNDYTVYSYNDVKGHIVVLKIVPK